ncbi:CoA ester lyase [Polynucleobacter sp. UK-Mo-2m-Kol15]|uniref:HpcH/HpaI aldolase/citrate lyase family protein n=1 Tax=Polynucleobacter sp. UK-Mo-2m-Kol15 TaxID=2576916 RepID=UPI001C0C5F67|nr:CoA ester lyase [Polynucleobacter sp. UK-Mo-2m-Kol15]MBU3574862.1 CoA ester lyase [Polynucleobacter sp. UK-Mo-2m-Kol15]
MRSKLFVPASRPELFVKALNSQADGLSFDLEDSVREDKKIEARNTLVQFLRSDQVITSKKIIIVRVNPMDTPYFLDDIAAVVASGVKIINLPKAESGQAVSIAARAIETVEKEHNLNPSGDLDARLLINIETPKSLRLAHELAGADSRVMGLQLGLGDLFEPYAIDRTQVVAVQQAMFQVAMAAHEAGIAAFDGAYANIADQAGYEQEARLSHSLGYLGKSCIHPSQIEIANSVFRPSDEEIAFSVKVIEAEHHAQLNSVGAFVVDGKMIDPPFANRARSILKMAQQLGLLN